MSNTAATTNQYPEVGVEFTLTLDGTDPDNHPLAGDAVNWTHKGPTVTGMVTKRFKLVRVGSCGNLDEVKKKLYVHGIPPEGQWRNAFKAAFPSPDGDGPIGFPDGSWMTGRRSSPKFFPFVDSHGRSSFGWVHIKLGEWWRWLVCVGE